MSVDFTCGGQRFDNMESAPSVQVITIHFTYTESLTQDY